MLKSKFFKGFSIKAVVLSVAISMQQANATGMPVIDIGAITQAVAGYVQQLKDIMMYEKQLEQMGIDLGAINSMLDSLKGGWDDLTNMAENLGNLNNLENVFSSAKSQCESLKSLNKNFANFISETSKELKGVLKENAEAQACLEALSNMQYMETITRDMTTEAQQALINGNKEQYIEKMKQVHEFRQQATNRKVDRQLDAIQKVNRTYSQYSTGQKSKKKALDNQMKDIQKSMRTIAGKTEKEKIELGLELQQTMLNVMLQQYDLMQNTSAMLATIFEVNSQKPIDKNNKPQKKLKSDFYDKLDKTKDYDKDPLGLPKFKAKKD